jgi:hydroxymethylpyrimidine pyrophosphatase-like HAD family hydrolase
MKSILALDVDGTITAHGRPPRAESLDRLTRAATAAAVEIVVATARPVPNVAQMFRNVGSVTRAICANGACAVEMRDGRAVRLLSEKVLDSDVIGSFLEMGLAQQEWAFLFRGWHGKFRIDCLNTGDMAIEGTIVGSLTRGRELRHARSRADELSVDSALAASLLVRSTRLRNVAQEVSDAVLANSTAVLAYDEVAVPGWSWVECVPERGGKADAMRAIEPRWATAAVRRIGVGDSQSDLGLLREADFSICPADAESSVLQLADLVAPVAGGESFADWLADWLANEPGVTR